MESTPLQAEADPTAAVQVLTVELDGEIVTGCADGACEVCGPMLEAAA